MLEIASPGARLVWSRSVMRPLRFFALTIALATATVSAPAIAQDAAAGEALFTEGKALAGEDRWAEACPKFEASYGADPTLGTLLNWADCLEKEGKVGSAYLRFGEAKIALESASDPRATVAEERRAALESRAPHLSIRSKTTAPENITVRLDGRAISTADITRDGGDDRVVDPGERTVEVRRGSDVLLTKKAEAKEGARVEIELDLAEIVRTHPEEPPLPPVRKDPPSQAPRVAGWVLVGTGGLALVGATVLEIAALSWQSDAEQPGHCLRTICTPTGASEAETAGDLAEAGQWVGIAGLGLLAIGVTLVIVAPSAAETAGSNPPSPRPRGTEVGLRTGVGRVALEGTF